MVVTFWQRTGMDKVLARLKRDLPDVSFVVSDSFYWSPKNNNIFYVDEDNDLNIWSLLHEASHALLEHKSYSSDLELLTLEVVAWDKAKELGNKMNIDIDEDHIQDCLDTYRDWLHQRSTCPSCSIACFQLNSNEYRCHNCYTAWKVSNSRFCRPYRLRNDGLNEKLSDTKPQTTFA
jgi:hypothetical protein